MFQLNFYPHADVHHTAFRAVCLSDRSPSLPFEAYRLMDFYLTFPFEIGMIRMRGSKLKKLGERFEIYRPYRWTSDPLQTFLQMIDLQTVAVRALARKNVVDGAALKRNEFRRSGGYAVSDDFQEAINRFLADRGAVIEALLEVIRDVGVTGKDGLKARTGLLPFKYDPEDNVVLN